MFESARSYAARHPVRAAITMMFEPLETLTTIREKMAERRQRAVPADLYGPDANWESGLHALLGLPMPCSAQAEFLELWPQVIAGMEAKGIRPGPASFVTWNDGDAALTRAIWCLTRHLRPAKVIETGVAHGVTSRFILEALAMNGAGHLWSIDRPPLDRAWHASIGIAVGGRHGDRWTYTKGSSRRHLPRMIAQLGRIDLFVHDSLHSEQNVNFELDTAWPRLQPGGAIVVDDVDVNWAFHDFMNRHRVGTRFFVCESEPLRPDLRRANRKGMFGIVLKAA